MSQTQTHTFQAPPNPSTPGTAIWLYDEIMRHIEPDLVSSMLGTHVQKYASESVEQRMDRMKAYDKAFAIFDQVAHSFQTDFTHELHEIKKHAHDKAQAKENSQRNHEIDSAESQLDEA